MDNHSVARTFTIRTEEQRQKDLVKIKGYRALEDEFRQHVSVNACSPDTFALTTRLLHLNPEYYTVWNTRRRCLLASILNTPSDKNNDDSATTTTTTETNAQTLTAELALTAQLLRGFPKCYWIWNHRLWTLQQCIALLPPPLARDAWEKELGLVGKMLTLDKRNFHAWGYRRKVVAKLEGDELVPPQAKGEAEGKGKTRSGGTSMVEHEFEYTSRMIRVDLSNFSAWHRRSQLIGRLLDERRAGPEERKRMLNAELDFIRQGLNVGPEDQSLWYYHQFLMQHVTPTRSNPAAIAPDLTSAERLEIATREIDEVRDLLEDYASVKWVYEALVEYVRALPLARGPGEGGLREEEVREVRGWIGKLTELDPMRRGRWRDLEDSLGRA